MISKNQSFVSASSRSKILTAVLSVAAIPTAYSQAADVTLNTTNTPGTTSFNAALGWSDGAAPAAGNNYFVPSGIALRTPADGASIAFAGDALTIGDNGSANGALTFKNVTNSTITINNLTLNKGSIQNGGTASGAATALILAGNSLTLGAGGGVLDSGGGGRSLNVLSNIVGSGPLSIIGGGVIQLTGANTYTGTTTVNSGATLRADDGVGLSSASNLSLAGGSLATSGTFTRAIGTDAGQVQISGAGGFTAVGADLVVALGGTASPTALTVGAGGFAPTSLFLNNGGGTNTVDFRNSIDLAGTTTFGVNVSNATAATGATLSGNLTDSAGTGTFTKSGIGLLTLTGTNTYAGQTVITGGTLRAIGASLSNANINFNGGLIGTNGTFTRSLGTGAGQVQWTGAATALGGFSADGGDLTVTLNNDAATPLVWGTTASFNPGSIVLGGPFSTGTTTLTNNIDLSTATATTARTLITQAGTSVVSGVISNSGAAQGFLVIEGNGTASGTMIFSNANTYGGTTQIDTGGQGAATVRATNSLAFGTSTILFNPGGNASTARLELANNINLANNVTFTGRGNTSVGIQNVSGNNTISGTISVTSGGGSWTIQSDAGSTLNLTGSAANASVAGVAVTSIATGTRAITLQGDGNGTVSGVIQNGSAALFNFNKAGAGTWTLTKANTFNGATAINGGTLQLGDGTSGHDGTIASTTGVAVASGATLAFNRFGDSTAAYVISGAGNVSKLGAGNQTLTGANSYTGTTTVSAGTLTATSPAYATILANTSTGLDIKGGRVVLDYTAATSPVGQVQSILNNGFAGNFATGQIRSSALPAGQTIGYGDNGAGAVLIRLTLPGDATLDGQVDFNDFLVLQNNFNAPGTRFDQGNFNFDGATDFNDFLILQNNFGNSATGAAVAFTGAEVAALRAFAAAVPEPTSLAVLGLGAAAALRRRRR